MDNEGLFSLTAREIGAKIKEGKLSSEEITRAYIDKIKEENKKYNAYITISDDAIESAKLVDERIRAGELMGPLAGVPIAIKDNICTKGTLTTCGSKMLENFIPPYDAEVITRIKNEGMVILGKTNMDEFAMGSTSETSYFGSTINPWGESRAPGGSSGGSAASIASNMAPISLGSDTGGSIRQPSSFCGVTGLKPTYGSVSRYGLVAFASSLDQIGPIGKDAIDLAYIMNIISGIDEKDQTSTEVSKLDLDSIINSDVKGLRIGIPEEYLGDGIDEDVKERVKEAISTLEKNGAIVKTFSMPIVEYAVPTYYIIACAEACSNLSRYDGIKYGYSSNDGDDLMSTYINSRSEGFGMEVKRRIMLGNFVLSSGYYDAYYNKALQVKSLIKDAFDKAFEEFDICLGPVVPNTAPKLGESLSDPLKMYMGDILTVLINIVGLPAMSIPCGCDSKGLPVGLQLIGKHYSEQKLLEVASFYQRITDFHKEGAN